MLEQRPEALALAVDDAHLRAEHPGWNGGWVMVRRRELHPRGDPRRDPRRHYYSSCGPELYAIERDGNRVTLSTSPVCFVRVVGPAWAGARAGSYDGTLLTEATFTVPGDWAYVHFELEDANGKRAWTNIVSLEG